MKQPPQLRLMSQCNKQLNFAPETSWPEGLPAVSVNGFVLAGFEQEFVFDHFIPQDDSAFADRVAELFRSLYFELTFVELARLILVAKTQSWFPLESVIQKFHFQPNSQFFQLAQILEKQPPGFQKWCAEKKVSPKDIQPLLSANGLDLKPVQLQILSLQMGKSQGCEALELGIELLLLGKQTTELIPAPTENLMTDNWLKHLRHLRYPETKNRDGENEKKMSTLPWPGTSQARWVRQGDRAGIELKLFVSNPTDLKKYLQGLSRVQEILDQETEQPKNLN